MTKTIESDDQVVIRYGTLIELLGRFGLPPWPDGKGGWISAGQDCAPLAAEILAALDEVVLDTVTPTTHDPLDTIELAWTIIANAYDGNWDDAPTEWVAAAIRWRDERWHPALEQRFSRTPGPTLVPSPTPAAADVGNEDLLPVEALVYHAHTTPPPSTLGRVRHAISHYLAYRRPRR